MDMFKEASKIKLRFGTQKGQVTAEDLWDLPLTSARGVSLDGIARAVNRELKSSEEESFVTTASKASAELTLKLEILKDIIASKVADREASKSKAENKVKKAKILDILAKKQNDSLENMSEEDLKQMVKDL
jgi:hypothetical protein